MIQAAQQAPRLSDEEIMIVDLMKERSDVHRLIRPLMDRLEQINIRLRAAVAAHEAKHPRRSECYDIGAH